MPEEIQVVEEQQTELPELREILGIVRRRRWLFLGPLFLGWALVWGVSWFLPTVYRSGTLILVDQPAVPEQYVVSNVNDDLQTRLNSITQQILSRTRLLRIIDELHLYQGKKGRQLGPDEKVDQMRKDIEIELVKADDRKLSSFDIYYSSDNPQLAQQTTSELADLFIRENLEARQEQSESTTKFLEDQLEEARKSLAEQDERVREFKDKHPGELPNQLQTNLQIMGSLQTQLQAEQDALSRAQQQQTYFESLLNQYRSLDRSGKGDGSSAGLAAIDKQMESLKAQLADLLSRYTEKHPDVKKLKLQIADLERTRAQVASGKTDDASGTAPAGDPREMAPKMELQSQLKANQIEIANRTRSIKDLQGQLNTYQARLNSSPGREQEYADITRDYNQSRANYDSLLAKKNQSEMATNLEKTQQGERFRMIDPPNLPTRPFSPNRLKMALMGLIAGFVLGAGAVFAAEYSDPRLHTERELKKLISAPLLADVPPLLTPEEESKLKRQDWVTVFAASVILCCMFAGFAITYLHG
jgi:polysaccharide chain length determinant protein (PEP-CTERM system associated)